MNPFHLWMMHRGAFWRRAARVACLACLATLAAPQSLAAADFTLQVVLSDEITDEPYSGRVYIFFSRTRAEPRMEMKFVTSDPFIAQDVVNWKPGEPLAFSAEQPAELLGYPVHYSKMDLEGYRAQAVVRLNPHDQNVGFGEGNAYSPVVALSREAQENGPTLLRVDRVVAPYPFRETKWRRLLKVRSKLLSAFHGRDVFLNAAIYLPASYYEEPQRRYPTILDIPGFLGTHIRPDVELPILEPNNQGVEFLRVMLDGSCGLGHHVFADSANNGPYEEAFITEFLPALNREYRTIAQGTARFLTGHSSGGWSSLWLQVTYPDHFGGTWSYSPDPVDFRDFQQINLYQPNQNLYVDAQNNLRPVARSRDRVLIWFAGLSRLEAVLGHGGQLHSFEAVFSERGKDGKPMPMWNRATGAIDPDVARSWERFDIRIILQRNWESLAPKLRGKLHVHVDAQETFYLEGAVVLLKETLAKLESDAVVEVHPGFGHGSYMTDEFLKGVHHEMVAAFLRHHDSPKEDSEDLGERK